MKNCINAPVRAFLLVSTVTGAAAAATPDDFLQKFSAQAAQSESVPVSFSVQRGKEFFTRTHGNQWSCASCHGDDPRKSGRHKRTNKAIEAMAPAVNAERFTSKRQVTKWFRRNCKDVLARECTAQEKGDVLTYLLSLKP